MYEWKEVVLGDIASYSRKRIDTDELSLENYVSTENMLPDRAGKRNASSLPSGNVVKFKSGQTLISNIRPYFKKILYALLDGGCSADVLAFDTIEEIDKKYFYYYLSQDLFFDYVMAGSKGTKMPRGDKQQIMLFPFRYPPKIIQKNIAETLSCIDDKIELNKKINDNLADMAQAVFNSYYCQANKVVPFTSVIQILGGGTPKTGTTEFWNGNIPFFTPKDVGNPYVLTTEKNITESGLHNCNSRLYSENTVFVTARGTVGKVSLAGVPMAMNQSCYALVPHSGISQLLAYHMTLEIVKSLKHKASGAVFDAIVTRDFESESIGVLDAKQAVEFEKIVAPIYDEMLINCHQNMRLIDLRDTLLPRLMSGEINVSDL